jgi:hypothetical protein
MPTIEFGVDRAPAPARATAVDPGPVRSLRDAWMVTWAWTLLALAELVMRTAGFASVYRLVRVWPTGRHAPAAWHPALVHDACAALVRARTLYLKRTRCLQRGVALTCLLRLWGVPAHLVIGVQKLPFYAHAWVEVNGTVVSDGGAPVTMYREMTRC